MRQAKQQLKEASSRLEELRKEQVEKQEEVVVAISLNHRHIDIDIVRCAFGLGLFYSGFQVPDGGRPSHWSLRGETEEALNPELC